jgi:hypothetical protein
MQLLNHVWRYSVLGSAIRVRLKTIGGNLMLYEEERDTRIIKGIQPSARIFGVEWSDAIAVMLLPLATFPLSWIILPPMPIYFNLYQSLGVKGIASVPTSPFDLNPVLPGVFIWIMLGLFYLGLRQNKPDGFLSDLYYEATEGIEILLSDEDTNSWEVGLPDVRIDTYLLDLSTDASEGDSAHV